MIVVMVIVITVFIVILSVLIGFGLTIGKQLANKREVKDEK